ncbi:MAG: DUF1957 domain-containing protein [Spirochaetales bacterium]|nr:DUF1957 domain-containing protein [Spirochaetales bacterium]MCF7939641.1 DUF1957 domain-containing protein [Spirochaetales bacterium]
MGLGYLCFVLHAHLPFVRHPEYEDFLEEKWLFEALSETYLPLLRVFSELEREEVPFRLTLSISPTLISMLTDELLQDRYIAHLEKLLELSEKELERTSAEDPEHLPVARMYQRLYKQNLEDFADLYQKNILKGFKYFQKQGNLELITTAASHSFLPLYQDFPRDIEAQIQVAMATHHRFLGKESAGMWVPECGYFNGLEDYLNRNNLNYFFAAAHGLMFASPQPRSGVYAPVRTPNGIAAFGRDPVASHAVWSAQEGYPSDHVYRDFYRDIGYDLPLDYIGPYIHDGNIRVSTGFKYSAITGETEKKLPYNPEKARAKAAEHAENFVYNRIRQFDKLSEVMDIPPLINIPFDAELFGHWWFEGPIWIKEVFRNFADAETSGGIDMVTPTDYLNTNPDIQTATPSFSSWGEKGYAQVWLDGQNDWIYRHIHKNIRRMEELAQRFPDEHGLKERALNQAAREVLLSQASDWPFIMKTGTTVPYAVRRVKEHIYNFNQIYGSLCRNTVNTEWLTRIAQKNNLFPDMDYRIFRKDISRVHQ